MKKSLLLISIMALTGVGVTTSSALNVGGAIDSFKVRHEKILFESLPFTATGANEILEYEYRINGLEALKNRIAEAEKFYNEKKTETTRERISLEKAIAALDASIKSTEESIADTQGKIISKQQKIQALEILSLEMKKKIADNRATILGYLANMYSEGNMIFDEAGGVDVVKTLLVTSEQTDFYLQDMTYKAIASELGQKFVEEYRALVREYYLNSVKTNEEKLTLERLKSYLQSQSVAYNAQKQEREKLLEITKWQEALYVEYVLAQQKAQKDITEAWKKANEDYEKSFETFFSQYNCKENLESSDCKQLRQFFTNEAELSKSQFSTGTENILTWPSKSRRVTAYFRDPDYYKFIGSHHDAVDIGTPQGSDVYSVADGYVYYIVPPTATSYSYVVIKHKNGMVSVYGHLSDVKVKMYQFVRQGELIAQSGGAPGTPGAGPATTGAHLHFELWKDKAPVDPMRFLTLADIDYKTIPARYQTKFVNDIVEKTGSGANTSEYKIRFTLKGDTEEERQKYMLKTYATPAFQDWEMWTDTAIAANIDPSFMMCIGLSETTLGNHLKTPYNIGNVGNTDSGATITFASPQAGISAMAKTFNNKYLGKYTKISELSRWGNQTGPIYASSASNWHDNTIRCLTALKGRFVEDDFKFRISTQK